MSFHENKVWFIYQPQGFEDITHHNGDVLRLKVAIENIFIDLANDFIKLN